MSFQALHVRFGHEPFGFDVFIAVVVFVVTLVVITTTNVISFAMDPMKPPNNNKAPHPVGNQDVKHVTIYTKEGQ